MFGPASQFKHWAAGGGGLLRSEQENEQENEQEQEHEQEHEHGHEHEPDWALVGGAVDLVVAVRAWEQAEEEAAGRSGVRLVRATAPLATTSHPTRARTLPQSLVPLLGCIALHRARCAVCCLLSTGH
jgi:hypothetical protein